MSKKDFKKGMEAGAKPFEEKFIQVSKAIKRENTGMNEKMDNINTKVADIGKTFKKTSDILFDYMSEKDKKEVYGLNTPFDIKELDPDEKELLVAGLYTLATMSDNYLSEYQKAFIRSVQKYLDVKTSAPLNDFSVVENIDSNTAAKAILQAFMEFLFLENENDSFLEDYEDLFEFFSVNKKGRDSILDCVHNVYRATGAQGIAEKYGYVAEIEESVSEDIDEITETASSDNPPVVEKYVIERELTIDIDDEIIIENKDITLHADILCMGTLKFINCKINYDISRLRGKFILQSESSSLIFEKCLFIHTVVSNIADKFINDYFITSDINTSSNKCKSIEFNNCNFINCLSFLNAEADDILFSNSIIENPLGGFLYGYYSKNILILNCEIRFKNLNLLKELNLLTSSGGAIFKCGNDAQKLTIRNSRFISDGKRYMDEYNNYCDFELVRGNDNAEICNCEFINLNCFQILGLNCIRNSYFYNLNWRSSITTRSYGKNWQYSYKDEEAFLYDMNLFDCLFVECSGTIYHNSAFSNKEVEISLCKFINITKNRDELDYNHHYSIFKFHATKENKYMTNRVKDCIFNGVELENAYLISGRADEEIGFGVVDIENCSFDNYKTNLPNQEIIKETDVYNAGIFTKKLKSQLIIHISDCIGLHETNTDTGRVEYDGSREITKGVIAGLTEDFKCGLPDNWIESFSGIEAETTGKSSYNGSIEDKLKIAEDLYYKLDYKEAYKIFTEIAKEGNTRAMFFLGEIYSREIGYARFTSDIYKANKWFKRGHDLGDVMCSWGYANSLAGEGKKDKSNKIYHDIFASLLKMAENGDMAAQHIVANCYDNGWGVEEDDALAFKWYLKAAERGMSWSQIAIGICYHYGWGVEENYTIENEWYLKAAKQGSAKAQYFLGLSYECGDGVEESTEIAVEWYRKAAEQGYADAKDALERLENESN